MQKLGRLAVASAVATLLAGAASAQDFGSGPFYLKGFGGATFPSSEDANVKDGRTSFDPRIRLDFNYDTGYTLGVAVGYFFTPNVAMEIEYAYRSADVTATAKSSGFPSNVRLSGNNDGRVDAFMLNALYVFDGLGADAAVKPYLGGGLGTAKTKLSVNGSNLGISGSNWSTDWNLAYQLIGGVGYEITPQWTLYGEGRWFGTESGKFDGPSNLNFSGSFETFDLLVGASYSF